MDLDCYKIKNSPNDNWVIFKNNKFAYVVITTDNKILENNGCTDDEDEYFYTKDSYTFVTREEIQSELAKHGKVFDFDEKLLKELKWVPRHNEECFIIGFHLGKFKLSKIYYSDAFQYALKEGSLKQTEQLAQSLCEQLNKVLQDNNN